MRRSGVSESTYGEGVVAALLRDGEHQPVLDDGELQRVGAVVAALEREALPSRMSKIATSRSCSMLGLPRPIEASSSLMATSLDLELGSNPGARTWRRLSLAVAAAEADGDRAAMRLQALGAGERHGGGRQASSARGSSCRIDVRFMKSSTPSPEEKRALRAVGSTWLEPAT